MLYILRGDMAAGMTFLEKITKNVFPPYSNSFECLLSIKVTFITMTYLKIRFIHGYNLHLQRHQCRYYLLWPFTRNNILAMGNYNFGSKNYMVVWFGLFCSPARKKFIMQVIFSDHSTNYPIVSMLYIFNLVAHFLTTEPTVQLN